MNDYLQFIKTKKHSTQDVGLSNYSLNNNMFDFQKYITEILLKKGRGAGFLDTGIGKTLIELVIAENYVKQTNKRVLIITPLSIAFQFVNEAKKFGIEDVSYSKTGELTSKIVICNYERLSKFNSKDFICVILDESSILKNAEGSLRTSIIYFLRKVKYRYLFTATPSPNDYEELGNSSEALGNLGYMDMLSKFFTNAENNIKPQNIGVKWYLKPHAYKFFFQWVTTWAIAMQKPSDLGFSDEKFILPNLIENDAFIQNYTNWSVNGQPTFFGIQAKTMSEIREENKKTISERCELAVELSSKYDTTVYWCNYNPESSLLHRLDKDSVELLGGMSIDKKEGILSDFAKGNIAKLITKPTITGFGLNWQHCGHTVYFPTFSFEQYYQAIRRFWRFGRTEDVIVDRVMSNGMNRVMIAHKEKAKKAIELFAQLKAAINSEYKLDFSKFTETVNKPKFM